MKKLTIRARILLGFTLVLLIVIASILFFSTILMGVNQQVDGLIGIENLVEADRDAYQSHLALANLVSGFTEATEAQQTKGFEAVTTNFNQIGERYAVFKTTYLEGDRASESLLQLLPKFDAAYASLQKTTTQIIQSLKSGKRAEANQLFKSLYQNDFSAMRGMIDEITNITYTEAIDKNQSISAIITNIPVFTVAGLALLTIIITIVALFIVWSISRQINTAIRELSSSSNQIASASGQLSRSSQEIANGAIEQASSIEETTSSMEELSSMVRQNALNSKQASILADTTAEVSDTGYSQMENMLVTMKSINEGSNQIKKIIKVIDDIAFQTNILALNAAVEAARAGEAGLGFAVVADEVKNLANRSATAARETADMIETSISRTQEGLSASEKLAANFKDIVANAKKLSEMSKEVETASRQQDIGIDQVNKAIIQFDSVVQSNASAAEETASAAAQMAAQVVTLDELVGSLRLAVLGDHLAVQQANHASTNHIAKAAPKSPRNIHKPEQLIPFEDDEDLKEY